jgi:uracil-DNA glycosylase
VTPRSETPLAIVLPPGRERETWWLEAAACLARAVPPDRILWSLAGEAADLFGQTDPDDVHPPQEEPTRREWRIAADLRAILDEALLHRDPERFALAYRLVWRIQAQPRLIENASDADVARAVALAKAVRRDMHKMKAFVRFRALGTEEGEVMMAWFEPEHHIAAAVAPFFMRRFATMRFVIVTPDATIAWDRENLTIGAGGSRRDVPAEDAIEQRWLAYYATIFNPARLKTKAMKAEMPMKYWRNLPEASLISSLIREAPERVRTMQARAMNPPRANREEGERAMMDDDGMRGLFPEARPMMADGQTRPEMPLDNLKAAVDACTRCPIHLHATQGVPGEGLRQADVMFVGEQPGDQEDLAGRPFVGPAGQLFNTALERVGIDRTRAYVTNAVKHFKFEPRGKRRIHAKPNTSEIDACRWWIAKEIDWVRPKLVVALGATAAASLTGVQLPVQANRSVLIPGTQWPVNPRRPGAVHGSERPDLLITVHPSFLLRLTEPEDKRREWNAFLADLRIVAERMGAPASS